jgi:hypothetical protein
MNKDLYKQFRKSYEQWTLSGGSIPAVSLLEEDALLLYADELKLTTEMFLSLENNEAFLVLDKYHEIIRSTQNKDICATKQNDSVEAMTVGPQSSVPVNKIQTPTNNVAINSDSSFPVSLTLAIKSADTVRFLHNGVMISVIKDDYVNKILLDIAEHAHSKANMTLSNVVNDDKLCEGIPSRHIKSNDRKAVENKISLTAPIVTSLSVESDKSCINPNLDFYVKPSEVITCSALSKTVDFINVSEVDNLFYDSCNQCPGDEIGKIVENNLFLHPPRLLTVSHVHNALPQCSTCAADNMDLNAFPRLPSDATHPMLLENEVREHVDVEVFGDGVPFTPDPDMEFDLHDGSGTVLQPIVDMSVKEVSSYLHVIGQVPRDDDFAYHILAIFTLMYVCYRVHYLTTTPTTVSTAKLKGRLNSSETQPSLIAGRVELGSLDCMKSLCIEIFDIVSYE